MIEYLVVLAFGVIVIMQGGSATEEPPIKKLATAIKDYHKHYTYAMSIATIPECDYNFAYDKSADLASVLKVIADSGSPSASFSVSGTVDRCVDWTDPSLPDVDVNFAFSTDFIAGNVTSFIQDIATQAVNNLLSDFLNPAGILSDMFSFDLGSFF